MGFYYYISDHVAVKDNKIKVIDELDDTEAIYEFESTREVGELINALQRLKFDMENEE